VDLAPSRVLVAGIGNVFLGDDGFGVAVAERLRSCPLPPGVRVVDFGIRAFDLALALERCAAAILVDAVRRGGAPGTVYVLAPDLEKEGAATLDGHALTADDVLRRLAPAARPRFLRIVGCEPETFGPEGLGFMGLSAPVRRAVDDAAALVESLVHELTAVEIGHA
jgi:hydrogenase maturation protease